MSCLVRWVHPLYVAEGLGRVANARYGISSFVYSARRPFHPRRLWDMVSAPFCVIQTEYEEEEDEDEEGEENEDEDGAEGEACPLNGDGDVEMDEEKAKEEALARMEEQKAELNLPARAKCKRESPIWKGVLRSKGFIWLATRPHVHGEWSQAGVSSNRSVADRPGRVERTFITLTADHVHARRWWLMDVPRPRGRVARRRGQRSHRRDQAGLHGRMGRP